MHSKSARCEEAVDMHGYESGIALGGVYAVPANVAPPPLIMSMTEYSARRKAPPGRAKWDALPVVFA